MILPDWWQALDSWMVLAGILSATSCALLGNFLVLRKMSLMGDAISHAVLPGLAVAFLITASRDAIPMFVGAVLAGVLTALLTQYFHKRGQLDENASMGVVFTTLFALGLVLISYGARTADLDPSCVLYGSLELIPFDVPVWFFGFEVPRAIANLGWMFLINIIFVSLLFKELSLTSFDPALADTLGISSVKMHYLLMTAVAMTTVAAFEAVGSILVVAMLIVPPAIAYLLTDRLFLMILISLIIAGLSAILGHYFAVTAPGWFGFQETTTSSMMTVVTGIFFGITWMFSPKYGLWRRLVRFQLSEPT